MQKRRKNSAAKIAANARYTAKAYDRIELTVKKGEKEIIKNRAADLGYSVNAYINYLISNDLGQNDNKTTHTD